MCFMKFTLKNMYFDAQIPQIADIASNIIRI